MRFIIQVITGEGVRAAAGGGSVSHVDIESLIIPFAKVTL